MSVYFDSFTCFPCCRAYSSSSSSFTPVIYGAFAETEDDDTLTAAGTVVSPSGFSSSSSSSATGELIPTGDCADYPEAELNTDYVVELPSAGSGSVGISFPTTSATNYRLIIDSWVVANEILLGSGSNCADWDYVAAIYSEGCHDFTTLTPGTVLYMLFSLSEDVQTISFRIEPGTCTPTEGTFAETEEDDTLSAEGTVTSPPPPPPPAGPYVEFPTEDYVITGDERDSFIAFGTSETPVTALTLGEATPVAFDWYEEDGYWWGEFAPGTSPGTGTWDLIATNSSGSTTVSVTVASS